ncbi:hypothetical protein BKA56DRAFT_612225 [Ilyonectria sp. MPI-CAGE-AT-0026]|nr:hypothetical protein BKA56DRAFT_612225 [Ilyonectria sp. MPI-CAGE-AT-0026]
MPTCNLFCCPNRIAYPEGRTQDRLYGRCVTTTTITAATSTMETTADVLCIRKLRLFRAALTLTLDYLNYANTSMELEILSCRAKEWCSAYYQGHENVEVLPKDLFEFMPLFFFFKIPSWYRMDAPARGLRAWRADLFADDPSMRFVVVQKTELGSRILDEIIREHGSNQPGRNRRNSNFYGRDRYRQHRIPFNAEDLRYTPVMYHLPQIVYYISTLDGSVLDTKDPLLLLDPPCGDTMAKLVRK